MASYFKSTGSPKGGLLIWVDESPGSVVLNNDFFGVTDNNVTTSVSTVGLQYTVNNVSPVIEINTQLGVINLGYQVNAVVPSIAVTSSLETVSLGYTVNNVIPSIEITSALETVNLSYQVNDIVPNIDLTSELSTVSLGYAVYDVVPVAPQNVVAPLEVVSLGYVVNSVNPFINIPTGGAGGRVNHDRQTYENELKKEKERKRKIEVLDSEIIEIVKITLTNFII